LREMVPVRQWLFYGIAFAGVFVLKGFDSRVSTLYLLIGNVSAICSGMAYNLVRRLREREEPIVVVLHFQLVGIAAGLVFSFFNWRTPSPWEWVSLLMCGVLTQIGQICLTKALQAERIAKVAVLNYIGLVYALIFSVAIFGEHYTAQTMLGIGRSASSERTGFQSPASLKAALRSLVVAGVPLSLPAAAGDPLRKTQTARSDRGDGNSGRVIAWPPSQMAGTQSHNGATLHM
jgi:drug/metabolite transporter (DMT)-like permease